MCGIAGYSLSARSSVNRTLAAQSLLAAIAERGADAVGYAHRSPASAFASTSSAPAPAPCSTGSRIPQDANEVLLHVRDYTKGHPRIEANNHPIRHGEVVGVHNGIIVNDEPDHGPSRLPRAEPEMTVDSEAIFALVDRMVEPEGPRRVARVDGDSLARRAAPGDVTLARGIGRPLWIGSAREETFFASTKAALELVERYLGLELRKRELGEGIVVDMAGGSVGRPGRFCPDRSFREEHALPAVRAPRERDLCLTCSPRSRRSA